MDKLEKVELVREKTGVSYQQAEDALEATDYDGLDAIIWLESNGMADTRTATFETGQSTVSQTSSLEMREAQEEYHQQSKKTKVGEAWSSFCNQCRKVLRAGIDMTFVAERHGQRSLALPVIVIVLGILCWGASIWLLILGLFFDFRYHIEGASPLTIDVNDAMNKAADAAESFKDGIGKDEDE